MQTVLELLPSLLPSGGNGVLVLNKRRDNCLKIMLGDNGLELSTR